jgi:hypothetical protein
VLLGFVLSLAGLLFTQRMPDKKLLVNGNTTGATVVQVDGRSYVDIETLARITNGLVTFEPNQIVLTIPNSNSDATSPQTTLGLYPPNREMLRAFPSSKSSSPSFGQAQEWGSDSGDN